MSLWGKLFGAKPDPKELAQAVEKGDASAVQALLKKGTDVNAKGGLGQTALITASLLGHRKVVGWGKLECVN